MPGRTSLKSNQREAIIVVVIPAKTCLTRATRNYTPRTPALLSNRDCGVALHARIRLLQAVGEIHQISRVLEVEPERERRVNVCSWVADEW
jgi:hypothetical protein